MANSTAPTKQSQAELVNTDLWNRLTLEYPEVKLFTTFNQWQDWQKTHTDWPTYLWEYKDQALKPIENEGTEKKDTNKQEKKNHPASHGGPLPEDEKDRDKAKTATSTSATQNVAKPAPQDTKLSQTENRESADHQETSQANNTLPNPNKTDSSEQTRIYQDMADDPVVVKTKDTILHLTNNDPSVQTTRDRETWYKINEKIKKDTWERFVNQYPEKAAAYAQQNSLIQEIRDRQKQEQEARQKRQDWAQEIAEENKRDTSISPEDISFPENSYFTGPPPPIAPEDFGEDIPMKWSEEDDGPVIDDTGSDDDSDEESSGSNLTDNIDRVRKLSELGEEAEGAEAAVAGSEAAVAGTEAAAAGAEAGALAGEAGTAATLGAEGAAAGGAIAGAGGAGATGAVAALGTETATVGAAATSEIWVPILVIAGVILLFLIIVIVVVLHPGIPDNNGAAAAALLKISKTGPTSIPNPNGTPTPLNYQITVDYPNNAQDVIVTDNLPEGTTLSPDSTTQPYTTKTDANGKVTAVSWSLSRLTGALQPTTAGTSQQTIDITKYTAPPYSLPPPNSTGSDITYSASQITALNNLGGLVAKYQSYLTTKVKNNNPQYVDPFLSVIWSGAIEGTYGNNYSWNCLDKKQENTINNGCEGGYSSGSWQVGYGIQVSQAAPHLADDFNAVYGPASADNADKVQTVGQAVIDNSKNASSGQIINPSTFPNKTVSTLVSEAKNGNTASQQAIAILLMDKDIGAISISREIAGDIASRDNWRATMEGWDVNGSTYYHDNMQKFSNRMQALAKAYSLVAGAASSGELDQLTKTLSITLLADSNLKDTYLVNQATAELVGASSPDTAANTTTSSLPALTGNTTPNTTTCGGKYTLNGGEHNGQNFGDPTCELAQATTTPFSAFYPVDPTPRTRTGNIQALLKTDLNQLDPANADKWQGIALCESGYDPNAVADAVNSTAYGLFQMAGGSVGNGRYDKGDVQWRAQTSNAIDYNNKVLRPLGLTWKYWECAKWLGLWSASNNEQ